MFNREKTGLRIFDNFQIDFNLPKWEARLKIARENGNSNNLPIFIRRRGRPDVIVGSTVTPAGGSWDDFDGSIDGFGTATSASIPKKESFLKKIKDTFFSANKTKKLKQLHEELAEQPNFKLVTPDELAEDVDNKSALSVEEFFKSIKNTAEELALVKAHYANYEAILAHLKDAGQVALHESMLLDIESYRGEAQLYATGHRKVLSEENIVAFVNSAPKKIRLDYVANFTRNIPDKIIDVKRHLDSLHIFDNYVVMHYDPDNKGNAMTEKEKADKEDPILFGVIAGRTNLYYIGDWVDKYCDLTFDKLVEILGAEAISANDITANVSVPISI